MFSYIRAKNNMFFEAIESKLNGELDGVIVLAEDLRNPQKNLYAIVFTDEKGYKRSLWIPEVILKRNNDLYNRVKNAIIIRIDRSWHDDREKIETMIFSGVIFYLPEEFREWRRKNMNMNDSANHSANNNYTSLQS